MALLNRVAQLFTADFHALLDRIEDPETLLKQAIRDMEEAISGQQQAIEGLTGRIQAQLLEAGRVQRRLGELGSHLDHAFSADDEQLARQLLRQRLLLERQQATLEEQAQRSRDAQQRQQSQLTENRATLDSMRQKLSALELAGCTVSKHSNDIDTVTQQEVDAAFLAEQRRRRVS